jgi:lipopolysaccharide transport protein LptA
VEIKQGTLLITADRAQDEKTDGKVRQNTPSENTPTPQQEIEDQGLVKAWAKTIEYKVGTGMVILTGAAEVKHPQYEVSGEQLRYDLNLQHFEGNGSQDGNGRVHIRLDPEVAPEEPEDPPESDTGLDPQG